MSDMTRYSIFVAGAPRPDWSQVRLSTLPVASRLNVSWSSVFSRKN